MLAWWWRRLPGRRARRRSDFNFLAFGLRCDPTRLQPDAVSRLALDLEQRWTARNPLLSPSEVARCGTLDIEEAVLAYGLLRLGSIIDGRGGSRDADQILSGRPVDPAPAPSASSTDDAGANRPSDPYRAAGDVVLRTTGSLDELVAAGTKARVIPLGILGSSTDGPARPRYSLAILVVLTGLGLANIPYLLPPVDVDLAHLSLSERPTGRRVRAHCDRIEGPPMEKRSSKGRITSEIYLCHAGSRTVSVELDPGDNVPSDGVVVGALSPVGLDARSPDEPPKRTVYLMVMAVLWAMWFGCKRRATSGS